MISFDSRCHVCSKAMPTVDGLAVCEACIRAGVHFCGGCEYYERCESKALVFLPRCPDCQGPMFPKDIAMYGKVVSGYLCDVCQPKKFVEEPTALPAEGPTLPKEIGWCMKFGTRATFISPQVAEGRMKFYRWLHESKGFVERETTEGETTIA